MPAKRIIPALDINAGRVVACSLTLFSTVAWAAPPKQTVWEYATVDFSASQRTASGDSRYGAELILPGKKVVFLETKNAYSANYKTYLFNRLGAQGWELAFIPGKPGAELYIFKRPK